MVKKTENFEKKTTEEVKCKNLACEKPISSAEEKMNGGYCNDCYKEVLEDFTPHDDKW